MKKIMNWLMLSCKKATELIEKKLLVKLSFKENMQLQLHKSMCSACAAYEKQSQQMEELFHKHINNDSTTLSDSIKNEDLKKRIIDNLSSDAG